jgi:alpha-tubulin suppressor-like RCC1 family protein
MAAPQVCTGDYHGIAVTSNGTLLSWGDNTWGQGDVPTAADMKGAKVRFGYLQNRAFYAQKAADFAKSLADFRKLQFLREVQHLLWDLRSSRP